ncbi:MAG: radical SAM protein, partial [Actinobacteria bacterium]|nr:radical SAM protein [Actinomycetota bacterium]
PDLVRIIAQTPGVVPYFDLSFQHSSAQVLRRMKRFGNTESFLDLLAVIRALNPSAGTRTNVIVGFPGETSDDVDELVGFLESAQLDAIGVFAYSDEEGTAAVKLDDHVSEAEIADRFTHVSAIAQRMCDAVANSRIGSQVTVLIDGPDNSGRAEHQGPEVDGSTTILADRELVLGEMVTATVVAADGIDLIAQLNQSNTVEMDTSQISGAQVNQVS